MARPAGYSDAPLRSLIRKGFFRLEGPLVEQHSVAAPSGASLHKAAREQDQYRVLPLLALLRLAVPLRGRYGRERVAADASGTRSSVKVTEVLLHAREDDRGAASDTFRPRDAGGRFLI